MDGRIRDRKRTRGLLKEISRPGGRFSGAVIALPLVSGLLLLVQAYWLADILHRAIVDGAQIDALLPEIGLLGGLFAFRAMLSLAGDRAATIAAERIKANLRGRLFGRLMAGKSGDNSTRASGALAVSVIEHVEQLDGYYARFRPAMIQAACLPLAFGIAMLRVDLVVALLFLFTAPLIPVFMALAGWGAEAAMRDQAQALTRLSGHFADRLRGIVTLKLFGRAESETAAVRTAGEALRGRTLKVLKIAFLSSAVLEFFAALGVAGVALYVGLTYLGFLHMAPGMTLRTGLFCLLMAPEVYQPLRLLAAHYHDKKSAESALDEIEAQVGIGEAAASAMPMIGEASVQPDAPAGEGLPLLISGMSVATPTGRVILNDVDLAISAGGHAVLVGESGAGKSSLLQAVARLRGFAGNVQVGDRPLEAISEAELRRQVSILNQKPFIFAGTIADNLRLANAGATDKELLRAVDRACLFRNVESRPLRLDTMLGEGESGLSGGQIQRLSLARVFLRDAGLLLLDEPTAHLDAATEVLVLDTLSEFAHGRTMLIATHSRAVVDRFPRVFRIVGTSVIEKIAGNATFQKADAA